MAAKGKTKAKAASDAPLEPLTLEWTLAELPSSQHRAGLAGLVLCVRYLHRLKDWDGTCEIDVRTTGATLRIDEAGLKALFDVVYAASMEDQEVAAKWKNKKKETIEPLREEDRTELDPKTKKEKKKKIFIYERVVPAGGPLVELDPTREGRNGLWIKLWRDFIWNIMRGVPAQREPFESRANRVTPSEPTDPGAVIASLRAGDERVDLPSTYFLGAQAKTGDDVPFFDRARFQFLLHFWPFAASVYVPVVEDRDGKPGFMGYAVSIPDVVDLFTFCEAWPEVLRARAIEKFGYVPRGAVVALPSESGLSLLETLRHRLTKVDASPQLADVVVGADVIHVQKQGNSVKLLGLTRVEPELDMVNEYARLQPLLWDLAYRRLRIGNLIGGRAWFEGFGSALSKLPVEQLVRPSRFAHDAREDFAKQFSPANEGSMNEERSEATLEGILLQVVGAYLGKKLKTKHKLVWTDVKDDPGKTAKYEDEKEKLAKGVFYAVRSRTGRDFVDYFASTLFSVPQHLDAEKFSVLSAALRERPEDVRTLTMLALSARS